MLYGESINITDALIIITDALMIITDALIIITDDDHLVILL